MKLIKLKLSEQDFNKKYSNYLISKLVLFVNGLNSIMHLHHKK